MIVTYRYALILARTIVVLGMAPVVSPMALTASAEDATSEQNPRRRAEAFFAESVLPIFQQHCYECHSHAAGEVKGGLLLDSRSGWAQGGDSGSAIVPGKSDESLLIRAVRYEDLEMPPTGKLSAELIDRLQRWVNEGAIDPRESEPDVAEIDVDFQAARQHWAFQPPVRPEIPHVDQAPFNVPFNVIDAFVQKKLEQHSLEPSPLADRRTLIRRVTLDLIGLPPAPEEVRDFVEDQAVIDVAYTRVVDRLLKSPRYGERWAQHWLDVIRWAETVGFETNAERANAWPYRDWVIDSLNNDKPYDRFIFEQLAGDTVGQDAALGFLVAGPANLSSQVGRDEAAMRQSRQDELDEVIRTVSQSLFGLTIGCARCHSHKFDPISQRDYYAMQAIFAGLSYGDRRLRGDQNDRWVTQVPIVQRELAVLNSELQARREQHNLRPPLQEIQTETFSPVRADSVRMEIAAADDENASLYEFEVWSSAKDQRPARNVALASTGGIPSGSSFLLTNQSRHFDNLIDGTSDDRQAFPWEADKPGPAWIQIDLPAPEIIDRVRWHAGMSTPADYEIKVRHAGSGEWLPVANTRDRLPRVSDMRTASDVQLDGMSGEQVESLFTLITKIRKTQKELERWSSGPQVYAASFSEIPDKTWLLSRGDPMQPSEEAAPEIPAILKEKDSPKKIDHEVDRRLELARHLTRPGHPLTARVMVNRIWQHHFGNGIVETPSDFGKMGAKPSHPQLLDWLATEFVARGWSMKALHRLIVTSQTYQQSSFPRDHALEIDAESRLLWRYPPRRLDAEAIRDSILTVSGKLNREMYGKGFDFFDQRGGVSDYMAKTTFDESGWRRMIYAHKIRMQSVDIFGTFDCPDAGQMTPRRNQSVTPIQSLGLFNSPFSNRQADFFSQRIRRDTSAGLRQWIEHAFEIALARAPSERERDRMIQLAKDHGVEQVCRVILNSSEFILLQ